MCVYGFVPRAGSESQISVYKPLSIDYTNEIFQRKFSSSSLGRYSLIQHLTFSGMSRDCLYI
jgi:hypothetical protein